MSDESTPSHTDQPPPATTPLALTNMDIEAFPATSGEADAAILPAVPSAKAGSIISISDSDTEGPVAPVAKMASVEAEEERGTKRRAESEASGATAKKSKTSKDTEDPETEETYQELKERANEKIKQLATTRDQYKSELEDTQKQLKAAEESRDEMRAEMIASEQKELAKDADRNVKATREKDWRNKTTSKLKAELQLGFDEKLAIKTRSIERRLGGKYATAERNLSAKLAEKAEKLESVSEELRKLKAQSKEEIRDLKALAKEQAQHGGPKAQQALKVCKAELKETQKELATAYADTDFLKKQITHHKAEINSEKTQKHDLSEVYTKTCTENQALSIKTAEWKQRCALLVKDSNISKDNHDIELRDLRAAHKHQLREMDKKWQLQADNAAESQARLVASQRTVFSLTNANSKLMKDNEAYQKQLQATAAEKRQKDEECRKLVEKLARMGGSSSEVAKMQGEKGERGERAMDGGGSKQVLVDAQQQTVGGVGTAANSSSQSDPEAGDAGWSFPPMS